MRITIVGTGYVGLVTGTCFAEMGNEVTCVDTDRQKVEKLQRGLLPIFEPGLDDLVKKNVEEGRLRFSTSLEETLAGETPEETSEEARLIFSAVGTPPREDNSADLRHVVEVAKTVGQHANGYFLLVTKSTVPVGTAAQVKAILTEELAKRGLDEQVFDVASNPEFLREGAAIKDFMAPDRIVAGVDSDRAKELLTKLYKPFTQNGAPILFMDVASAEMTKYAANAMLATRISFMNEIANLCEAVGADVDRVREGIGTDPRIGSKFLYAGAGYGGSCFPKDIKALCQTGRQNGLEMPLIEAVERVNAKQKLVVFEKLKQAFGGDLRGKTIAVWGLSFRPETDDLRQAPSLVVIEELLAAGASVRAFDPAAMDEAKKHLGDRIVYCRDIYETVLDTDAVALMTEWKQFRMPSWSVIRKTMRGNVVVDGRNIYDPAELKNEGFRYARIGRKFE